MNTYGRRRHGGAEAAGSQLPGTWNFGNFLRAATFHRAAWKTKGPAQGRQNEAKEGHWGPIRAGKQLPSPYGTSMALMCLVLTPLRGPFGFPGSTASNLRGQEPACWHWYCFLLWAARGQQNPTRGQPSPLGGWVWLCVASRRGPEPAAGACRAAHGTTYAAAGVEC